jgi:anti-anti-sigma factor
MTSALNNTPQLSPDDTRGADFSEDQATIVLRISGRLDTLGSLVLDCKLAELLNEGLRQAILDMEKVPVMGSRAIEALTRHAESLYVRGGQMHLCHLTDLVAEAVELADLGPLLAIHESVDEAVDESRR